MNAAASLIAKLRAAGVSLHCEGTRLFVEAPDGVITPEVREELVRLKHELLAALELESRQATSDARAGAFSEIARLLTAAYLRYAAIQRVSGDQPRGELALLREPSVHGVVE